MKTDLCHSFPFSADSNAKMLILGSMPGKKSLEQQQYYAHPQNIFWDIMAGLFGAERELAYKKRLQVLKKNQVALWDVAQKCERPGSLDSQIKMPSVIANDFKTFFQKCPQINAVFFNGHKAEDLFHKLVVPKIQPLAKSLYLKRLPSTSPAHAGLSRKHKQQIWKEALQCVF